MEKRRFNRLLKKIKRDEKAFDAIYDFYYKRIVYHLSRNYGKELAEDIAHEFFLKLIKNNKEYNKIEKPTSWVYRCCENLAKTAIKKKSYNMPIEDNAVKSNFDFANIRNAEIRETISALDEISKKIVYLHYWEGYAFSEVAEIVGLSYDAVRQRHKRLKKYLSKVLK